MSHIYEDEELRCLTEARRKFEEGWSLIDQAIFAKYTTLMKEERHAKTNGDREENKEDQREM